MRERASDQKAPSSAVQGSNLGATAGAKGVALAPPTAGIGVSDQQPLQLMADVQTPNRTGLPDQLKAGVERLSGLAMDDVRVHYNSARPAQLQALAYTQGTEIYIAPGQARYLPHEAWHVVQQAQGRVRPTMQMKDGIPVNDDEGLEREADVMGTEAAAGAARAHRQDARRDPMLTQGQLAIAQRQAAAEEEEPLQGRFETAQRQGAEKDELQMKAAPAAPVKLEVESPAPQNRTVLSDGLKTGIESLSGTAMDHVQVPDNSVQPAQLTGGAKNHSRRSRIGGQHKEGTLDFPSTQIGGAEHLVAHRVAGVPMSTPTVQRVVIWGSEKEKQRKLESVDAVWVVLSEWVYWMNSMCVMESGTKRVALETAIQQLLDGPDFEANDEYILAQAVVAAAAEVPHDKWIPIGPVEGAPADALVGGAPPVPTSEPRLLPNTSLEVPELTEQTSYVSVGDAVKGTARPDPRSIFIGRPTIDDIHQGSIGTCYFLSHLILVAQNDVSYIVERLITYDDSSQTAVVSFWYQTPLPPRSQDGDERPWETEKIHVDLKLAFTESGLKGAKLRRDNNPTDYADNGGQQGVVYYRTALWVPLLEKAYAIFAEQYGQFGYSGLRSAKSGYEVISTGARTPHRLLRIIYGPALGTQPGEVTLPWGDELDDDKLQTGRSLDVISQLVDLNTARLEGKKTFLTANLGESGKKRDLFITNKHVYAVMNIELRKTNGDQAENAKDVDPRKSTVVLRNPHRAEKNQEFTVRDAPKIKSSVLDGILVEA